MERNQQSLINSIFVGALALVLLIGTVRTLAFPKDINVYENRVANKVGVRAVGAEAGTAASEPGTVGQKPDGAEAGWFVSGEFQDSVESAYADQVPLAEGAKKLYNTVLSGFKSRMLAALGVGTELGDEGKWPRSGTAQFRAGVVKLTDEINIFGDHLYYSKGRDMWDVSRLDSGIEKINKAALDHPELNFYVYYVERDIENDFESGEKADLAGYMREHLGFKSGSAGYESAGDKAGSFGVFEVSDFDTFDKYFYKTDHHWNYLGSYKAYLELADMMGFAGSDSTGAGAGKPNNAGSGGPTQTSGADLNHGRLKPAGPFNVGWLSGSRAAGIGESSYKEIHQVYEFDFPEINVTINGLTSGIPDNTDGDYGSQAECIERAKARGADSPMVNYAIFYGKDYAEVVFRNKNGNGKSLLIFGDSFDNAVLKLLASHYSSVYSIDARWYEHYTGRPFDFDQYVKAHPVDDVLFLGSNTFFENPY